MDTVNISLNERLAMADACEDASKLAIAGSNDADLLAQAAKVLRPGCADRSGPHFYVEMADACLRAASGTRGITEAVAKRAALLGDAGRLLKAHSEPAPAAAAADGNITGAPSEQEREEWISAIQAAARGYTSSSDMHRGLTRAIAVLTRPADSFALCLDEIAAAARACGKVGPTLQVTADTTPLRLSAERVEKAGVWISRLAAGRACHLAAKSSEHQNRRALAMQLLAAKELLNGTACPAHYNAESLKHAAYFTAEGAKVSTDTLVTEHLRLAHMLLEAMANEASERGHERLGPADTPVEPSQAPAPAAAPPRKPLPPLTLRITCAPEGGWIVERSADSAQEALASRAAFTTAADLLPWLAERLHNHENPLIAETGQ